MLMTYKKEGMNFCVAKAKPVNTNCLWVEYVLSLVVFVAQLFVEMQVFQVIIVSKLLFFIHFKFGHVGT